MKHLLPFIIILCLTFISSSVSAQVTDIDGNVYQTVTIGTQVWMKENLKVTHFQNGDAIPNILDNTQWNNLSSTGFCWFNNDEITYKNSNGGYYNFYAVADNRNICPAGWNVPNDNDWKILEIYLGMSQAQADATDWRGTDQGSKIKNVTGWTGGSLNSNSTGFSALPVGIRSYDLAGAFAGIGSGEPWWTSTETSTTTAIHRYVGLSESNINRLTNHNKKNGFSVRCFKNDLTSGLVAYYPFNGNANDESGNVNNGTINGAIPADDRFGNASSAYQFSTSYITVNDAPGINPTSEISISFWVNSTQTDPVIPIAKRLYNGAIDYLVYLNIYSVGKLGFMYTDALNIQHSFSTTNQIRYNDGNWHNISVIYTSGTNSSLKIYLDGIDCPGSWIEGNGSGNLADRNSELLIGKQNVIDPNAGYFSGKLDEVRIYNHSLSIAEISSLCKENGWPQTAPVLDLDGNTYDTVKIGTQTWMKQNLKTTKLNDGTSIALVTDVAAWSSLSSPGYCWYNNDETANKNIYGALYNWYTVSTGKLCPSGWHVPTDSEIKTLEMYLGLTQIQADATNRRGTDQGNKLKEAGTIHWSAPSVGTNSSGFTALPGGARDYYGSFGTLTIHSPWWSSTELDASTAWLRSLYYTYADIYRGSDNKKYGFSVRCLKNDLFSQPFISSFAPTSGPIGTTVIIIGTNFSPTLADNAVWFGATKATVTAATTTQLTVTVPPGSTYQPISVTVNGLTAYSDKPFVVTFSPTEEINTSTFTSKTDFNTGSYPEEIAVADIDTDGKPDIAVANYADNTVSVLRNTSTSGSINSGSLSEKVDFTTGTNPRCVIFGDIDGDGKQDMAVTNFGENTVSVFRNTSTSGSITSTSFSIKTDFITGANPYYLTIGDIDLDGKPDLAVSNFNGNSISVFRNISTPGIINSGSFSDKVDFVTGTNPYGIVIKDINGDRKPELIVANSASNNISVFQNNSTVGLINSGSLSGKTDFVTGTVPYGISSGDLDSDGNPDLAIANYNSNTVSVLRNNGASGDINTSSFADKVDFNTGSGPFSVSIGDIDGNGKPDLAISNTISNTVSVLSNKSTSGSISSSSFSDKTDFSSGIFPLGVAIADFDLDFKPDLIFTNSGGANISVARNLLKTSLLNAPVVGVITHPTCSVSTGSVILSGLPSTGTWTLTRSPGGTTTQGTGTSTTISGLVSGSYTYTVTDASGSISASSSTIVINAQPTIPTAPTVGTITQPTCLVQTGSIQLSGLPSSGSWTLTKSSDNSTSTGTGTSATLTGLTAETFTYTVTNSSGCISPVSSGITIDAPPVIPSVPSQGTKIQPTCLAPAGSITINGLPSGNWTLTWTPGGATSGNTSSTTVSGLSPGTYSFAVTGSSGCTSDALENVVIQAVPVGNVPKIEKKWNSVLICYSLDNVFSSWQWYRGTELVSTGTTKAFLNTNKIPGTYKVYTTDKNGCKNYSNSIDIVAGSKSFTAYPNPANGILTVSMIDESRGKTVIQIINSGGIKVREIQTEKSGDNFLKEIPVNNLEQGIYTIKITVDQRDNSFTRLVITK